MSLPKRKLEQDHNFKVWAKCTNLMARLVAKFILKYEVNIKHFIQLVKREMVNQLKKSDRKATAVSIAKKTGFDRRDINEIAQSDPFKILTSPTKEDLVVNSLKRLCKKKKIDYIPFSGKMDSFEYICERHVNGSYTAKAVASDLVEKGILYWDENKEFLHLTEETEFKRYSLDHLVLNEVRFHANSSNNYQIPKKGHILSFNTICKRRGGEYVDPEAIANLLIERGQLIDAGDDYQTVPMDMVNHHNVTSPMEIWINDISRLWEIIQKNDANPDKDSRIFQFNVFSRNIPKQKRGLVLEGLNELQRAFFNLSLKFLETHEDPNMEVQEESIGASFAIFSDCHEDYKKHNLKAVKAYADRFDTELEKIAALMDYGKNKLEVLS